MAEMTVSQERYGILIDAVYELDKLARVVPDLVPLNEDQAFYAVRGLCGRMLRLTKILMSGLNDEAVSDDTLKHILELAPPSQG